MYRGSGDGVDGESGCNVRHGVEQVVVVARLAVVGVVPAQEDRALGYGAVGDVTHGVAYRVSSYRCSQPVAVAVVVVAGLALCADIDIVGGIGLQTCEEFHGIGHSDAVGHTTREVGDRTSADEHVIAAAVVAFLGVEYSDKSVGHAVASKLSRY